MGAVLEDIAGTIHAHPTMTEMTHEAALASLVMQFTLHDFELILVLKVIIHQKWDRI